MRPRWGQPLATKADADIVERSHVAAVRRLFVDRLTPDQLDAIGDAAEVVLAALDEPPAPPRR